MLKTIRLIALTGTLALALTGAAFAHAHLKQSTPAAGSTVTAPPTEIDLTFTEAVNPKFTGIELTAPDKKVVATGDGMLMDDNVTLMLPILGNVGPGTYTVTWHALSKDGHKTKGSFTFKVKP